jgi:Beige/BEACH domain
MFINKNNYEYGLTQEKVAVDNVFLPEWCNQNPFVFVSRLRKELENKYVS